MVHDFGAWIPLLGHFQIIPVTTIVSTVVPSGHGYSTTSHCVACLSANCYVALGTISHNLRTTSDSVEVSPVHASTGVYAEDQENVEERSGKKIADVLKIFPPLPQFSGKLDPTVHLEMLTEYFKQMVGSGKITKDEMFDFIKNDLATCAKNQ
ncbi:hypothetical protein Plhal304r1_c057g0142421 [Plasmopara halstedii]